ncbi:Chaperone DnaJ-like protein [Rhynchospora pubera]|uniref:Chaperone DnaJ-like protein n=1 Tax=Rhynchospora pubera TaxID=906938 RepID=A0AAV8EE58_9POAL|nr:Chaperone DnaJ-like protein [Rhynchospora pubera]
MISSPAFSNLNSATRFRIQIKPRTRHIVACIVSTTAVPRTPLSLYDVLGIKKGATYPEIKSAYRRSARECHPDTVGDDQKAEFADEFMRVHAAYTTLSDPNKRADYDRDMMVAIGGRSRLAPSRRSCRAWETDQCW